MSTNWLTASSFELTQQLIEAITTLSIHAKLSLAGQPDPTERSEVDRAREQVLEFMRRFQPLVRDLQTSSAYALMNVDPRFSTLVNNYIGYKERRMSHSPFFTITVLELEQLINFQETDNLPKLIEYLQEMRRFVEIHADTDATGLFGNT